MARPLIIVTGKNGQLGRELEQLHSSFSGDFDFVFTGKEELDLSKPETIPPFIQKHKPQYFINCAAYTAVDKAESEKAQAYTINAESVGAIAEACSLVNCKLITISTDYVFDGKGKAPYPTDHPTDPINYYGYSKQQGEIAALQNCKETVIIRSSWIYSPFGNNFVKTMLRLMKEKEEISVVNDQIGSPTYAADLAQAIMKMINQLSGSNPKYGLYHFSNDGIISWYDFAVAIKSMAGLNCRLMPVPTIAYPTPAKRPHYSVLDKQKIVGDFGIELRDWKLSLKDCLQKITASQ